MSELIRLQHIEKTYHLGGQTQRVLKGLSFTILTGEMVSIMGASGSGKSTLMNIIGLLDRPTAGEYWLRGKSVKSLSDDKQAAIRNQTIGFVFQQFHLLPKLSAYDNVALPLLYSPSSTGNDKERVLSVLESVGVADKAHHKPMELSGGQQQRVAIARALVLNPPLILADEPTGALDSKTSNDVLEIFHTLNQTTETTIVIITHDDEVSRACQRELKLVDGVLANETVC